MNSIGFVVSLYVHQENSTDCPLAEIYASVLHWKFVVEFGGLDAGGALGGIRRGKVGGQAVLGRQESAATPWLTERHGYVRL